MDERHEKKLKESLQARWPESPPAQTTHAELLARMKKQNTMKSPLFTPLRALAGLVVLVLLAITLNLALDMISTDPSAAEEIAGAVENGSPGASPSPYGSDEAEPTESGQSADPPAAGSNLPGTIALFPQVTWQLPDTLPASPASIVLYRQVFGRPADEAAALEMAGRLGIAGTLTSYAGEGGGMIYQVEDATNTLILLGFADQFSYFSHSPLDKREPLPFAARVRAAEDFLNTAGLLTFPYRAEQDPADPRGVRFVQLLDGLPLVYGLGMNPGLLEWITASVDADGVITRLFHSLHDFQAVDTFPLLTPADAWRRIAGPSADTRSEYAVLAAPLVWTQPGVPLEETLSGYLGGGDGVPELYVDDGRTLILDEVPPDLPLEVFVQVRGVISEGHITWGEIFIGGPSNSYGWNWSCGGFGGGGGGPFTNANFGGGQLARVILDGSPTAAAQPTYTSPILPGHALEAILGTVSINEHIYPNGVRQTEINFWYPGDEANPDWTARLEVSDPLSLYPLQNLPGKLWGVVSRIDETGMPVIQVDRIEAAYPGIRIQAWAGLEESITLEGREVLLLTTDQGEQLVVGSSIDFGEDDRIGTPGDIVILEGYLVPGDVFGGYPVITVLAGDLNKSFEDYEIQSSRIGLWDETFGALNQAAELNGNVTIEQVELAYAAVSLERCGEEFLASPGSESWLYVQPVWRFLGTFDDGRTIEILVQALPDALLK